jgi:hypothetical protein
MERKVGWSGVRAAAITVIKVMTGNYFESFCKFFSKSYLQLQIFYCG